MKTYGTICDCGNIKNNTEKMCLECKRLEWNNRDCHIRNMTCWSKDRIPTVSQGLGLRGKANAPVWD